MRVNRYTQVRREPPPQGLEPSHVEAAAVGGWRQSGKALEKATKGGRISIANLGSDIVHGMSTLFEKLLCLLDAERLDIVQRAIARSGMKATGEGSGREARA